MARREPIRWRRKSGPFHATSPSGRRKRGPAAACARPGRTVRPSVRHSVSLGWIGPAHLFRQRSQACTLQRERRCLHLSDGASPRSDDQCTTWSSKKTFFARGLKASLLLRPPLPLPSIPKNVLACGHLAWETDARARPPRNKMRGTSSCIFSGRPCLSLISRATEP